MPRRPMPPDPPNYSAALQAVKAALDNGRKLTVEEENEFLVSRAKSSIKTLPEVEVKTRRGQTVFRTKGIAGADLLVHPEEWKNKKKQRNFEAEMSKTFRRAPSPEKGVAVRRLRAEVLASQIVELAKEYECLGQQMVAKVAGELKTSEKHVEVVLKQKRI